ncbi:MAG: hypothetical protein KF914_20200 [Rhizobiaceae bacterium]|nr:hypothetical protein [Rhizobiaceae bacterium]
MNVHARYIDLEQARKLVLPVVEQHFAEMGFIDASMVESEDFEGGPIFRVDANVTQEVPASVMADTLADIHTSLRSKGDDRVVFLTARLPGDAAPNSDEDTE